MPSDSEYRLDFAILVKLTAPHSKQEFKIFIECDGYEFHKEPEQIAKDNLRANELKANGWMEFRYSGKMIWDDQFNAAKDFDRYLYSVIKAHGDFFDDNEQ
jgi:very-short-patch-repair endonuclease